MLDTHHSSHSIKSVSALILELAMIVVGVFLGLMAEQWREGRHEHELAQASLRNFRAEIVRNEAQIRRVRPYHDSLAQNLGMFVSTKGPHTIFGMTRSVHFQGIRPVDLEHTAWDMALGTQSLSYLEPNMAYSISRLYTRQQSFQSLENAFTQSAFTPATFADTSNGSGLALAMLTYLGDVNIQEPLLLRSYAAVLPRIDSALGMRPSPASTAPAKQHGD